MLVLFAELSVSEHFSNNDRVGGPLGATNKDSDRAGDPTVTFISKSWNPESDWSYPHMDYAFVAVFFFVFALEETLSDTVSTYRSN